MDGNSRYVTFCDGSSTGKVGPGGWGVVHVSEKGDHSEHSGYEEETTNQRMELEAAIQALDLLPEGSRVMLVSDSAYVINGMRRRWYVGWQQNGWKNAQGKPVSNADLWVRLIAAEQRHERVFWQKTKGHAQNGRFKVGNDRADQLAREAKEWLQRAMNMKEIQRSVGVR